MLKPGKLYKTARGFSTGDEYDLWLDKDLIMMFINCFKIEESVINHAEWNDTYYRFLYKDDTYYRFLHKDLIIEILVNKWRDLLNEEFLTPV